MGTHNVCAKLDAVELPLSVEIAVEISIHRIAKETVRIFEPVACIDVATEPTLMTRPFRVEVCGGMASGKTTFANLFSDAAHVILEDFAAVPFWRAFFDYPGSYNFETELSFLLQHYHQIKRNTAEGGSAGLLFCDFSFVLDRAYADVSLAGSKRQAFSAILHELLSEIGPPQLIVHLQCSAGTALRRVQGRRRSEETAVTCDFLESVNAAVAAELAALNAPITVVPFDSDTQDFATDLDIKHRCRALVLNSISEVRGGIHY